MVSAVASNNIVAMNKDKDLFDSEKRLKAATNDKVQLKLTSAQKQIIDFNQCLLLLYMNKVYLPLALSRVYPCVEP
jgi:signal recognition particle subunit SRP72